MRIKQIILLSIVSLFLLSCEEGNIDLDNAGDDDLQVQIDEVKLNMPANSYKNISLEPGLHTLVIQDASGKVLDETRFKVEQGGLINLAKAPYVVWTELYGSTNLRKEKLKLDYYEIETEDGKQRIWGEFEKIEPEDFYVEQTWDYGLDQPFEDHLWRLDLIQDKYVIMRKIFREIELLEEYKALQEKQ
ncbi:MAG: hypothetical protein AAFY71_08980 [Bacteroidota bacterium]